MASHLTQKTGRVCQIISFFSVSLTKFVCPWPVLSLSNLNGISDEYKIQIQVSQDKQYFDCILNKEDRDRPSHRKYKIFRYIFWPIIIRVFIIKTNMSIDCLSVCKIIDMIYY